VNAVNANATARKLLDKTLGIHPDAPLPKYHSDTVYKRDAARTELVSEAVKTTTTTGKVALFATCYGIYNEPEIALDLIRVYEHNGIPVRLIQDTKCCGMPKLELGDLEAVVRSKDSNIPLLAQLVDEGWDIVTPIPSCTLMFKQELPLMFPDDADVARVRNAIYDPFEYLMLRHRHGMLKTGFSESLGIVAYHVACHLRVQNIGMKTRDILQLIPGTTVEAIERCSGHDGTYAVKREYHEVSMKICRPVVSRVVRTNAAYYSSDCPMAGHQIENGLSDARVPEHPLKLLRQAYGI
jgi:Fe-S oxidoreductase